MERRYLLLLLGLIALTGCGSSSTSDVSRSAASRTRCASGDLKLSLGPTVVPATGEEPALFVLTNQSQRACTLDGYPHVILTHRRRRLAFVYRQGGGVGGYVTARKPRRVTLGPRRRGYFLVAKYRCDGGELYTATGLRVSLPGTTRTLTVGLGGTGLDYCRRYPHDSRVDPGNRVAVSPIEPSLRAT